MDDTTDEHDFSDDDFAALPDTALRELEHNAIVSTQQPASQTKQRQLSRQVPVPRKPPAHSRPLVQAQTYPAKPTTYRQDRTTTEDGFDDDSFDWIGDDQVSTPIEEVTSFVDRRPPGETTQREQWRQERFSKPVVPHYQAPAAQHTSRQVSQAPSLKASASQYARVGPGSTNRSAEPTLSKDDPHAGREDALLARIEELMKERDGLTKDLHTTKTQVETQQGEIAIIRDNKNKETKLFDRQLSALKKLMQEEAANHEAALAILTKKTKDITEHNSFLEHELAEESEKNKLLSTRLKQKPAEKTADPITTPRKHPDNSLRDGFDDDEIMVMSPSKSAKRSKPPTPTAVTKRKRKVDGQSPIKPLMLRQTTTATEANSDTDSVPKRTGTVDVIVTKDRRTERHLQFLQKILNYQMRASGERLVERLMKLSFPSSTTKTLGGILLDAASRLRGARLPADVLQIFLDLWTRCLREKFYNPISDLIEVTDFIIELDMSIVDKTTITNIIAILEDSATINGSTRFKNSPVYHSNFGQFRQTPQSALNGLVNGTRCIELLYKVACIVSDDFALLDHFWRSMTTDFVLMMLNPWQPVSDITLMFHLLATSIFPGTFGNVCSDAEQQNKMEAYIIDRVCYLLWEVPKVEEGLQPPSKSDLCRFRIEAMSLLSTLAIDSSMPPHDDPHHHGSNLLASHPSAIARLVRSLYDEVAQLYLFTSASSLHAELVNMGVRLLYNLLHLHGEELDMQKKLSAVNGGIHKFRVVLTRLSFSEGWYVDREITNETVAMATTMLEDSVTPDEADMMIEAFPNFTGRKNPEEMDMDT